MNNFRSWIIVVLLALLVVFVGYQTITQFSTNKKCQDMVLLTQVKMIEQQNITDRLMTDYESNAYENTTIERITEQQLIAAESQITALQVIANQNILIFNLMSACK